MKLFIIATLLSIAAPTFADNWGDFQSDNCIGETFNTGVGLRQYSSILWGIPPFQSWEDHCARASATVQGQYFNTPTRCINDHGINMWGEFDVKDQSCSVDHNWLFEKIGSISGKDVRCDFSHWNSDGCSVPLKDQVTKNGKTLLHAPCVVHDYCYATPASFGITKDKCDTLVRNMGTSRCNELNNGDCTLCSNTWFSWPFPYFFQGAYDNAQRARIQCTLTAKQRVSSLYRGTQLNVGDRRWSPNGKFFLLMQNDGNLVIYKKDVGAIWSSNTMGSGANRAAMQDDGNFVLYAPNYVPKWASGTNGRPDNLLLLQDDGNMVIYAMGAPTVQWSTRTGGRMIKVTNLRIGSVNSTSVMDTGNMTMQESMVQDPIVDIVHFDEDSSSTPHHDQV